MKRIKKKKRPRKQGCYNCAHRVDVGNGKSVCRCYYPMVVMIAGRHAKEYNYCGRKMWERREEKMI